MLDLSVYPHVEVETGTHKMWNKLKDLHEHENMQNKSCLIRKLVNMKYKDECVLEYCESVGNYRY